ncbi:hypothetical protein Zmor_013727 [Zophobas morio]|uniref:Uncharacterized protein n=1 Tax=Zophobas morio TaxID=2755281 RepID=A0AA38MFN4_9CUCU|nr:hypothetical protein Zmor_013727 [Zophobas morio]
MTTFDWNMHLLYSNVFIVVRTLLILWSGVQLNNESKKLAVIIHFANLPTLNVEIIRLLTLVNFDTVFFSGCRLFNIKGGIILRMLGGILTYELAVVQYGGTV